MSVDKDVYEALNTMPVTYSKCSMVGFHYLYNVELALKYIICLYIYIHMYTYTYLDSIGNRYNKLFLKVYWIYVSQSFIHKHVIINI